MKLTVALENEKKRSESESWNKIYLHKDGKFYHAYEWSAWLIKAFVCTEELQKQRGDSKLLSAFIYRTKNSEYVILGFPVESLSKYIPNYEDVSPLENDDLLITVSIDFGEDMTAELISDMYNQWRVTCEVKDSKKTPQGNKTVVPQKSKEDFQGEHTALARSEYSLFHSSLQVHRAYSVPFGVS